MVWSNWRGAMWRGAAVVVLFWSGLAWTQTSPRPTSDPAERIMVVHENGKSTCCRVLESWQLPDGKIAHLLESTETGDRITIVDEFAPSASATNSREMPKRIFSWGPGRRMAPEGSPLPPLPTQLRHDSGIVIKNETPSPIGPIPGSVGATVIQQVDDKALSGLSAKPNNAPPTIIDHGVPQAPLAGDNSLPPIPHPANPTSATNMVPQRPTEVKIIREEVVEEKQGWRPGSTILGWMQCKPTSAAVIPAEPIKVDVAKKDDKKTEDPFALQNKMADKHLQESVERMTKTPFSTAMLPPLPAAPKPDAAPQSIPKDIVLATDVKKGESKPDLGSAGTLPMLPSAIPLVDPLPFKPEVVKLPAPAPATVDALPIKPEVVKLPAPAPAKVDPLLAPERLIQEEKLLPKATVLPALPRDLPPAPPETMHQGWPIGTQSVAAAKSGLMSPGTLIPVPVMTVPHPNSPPMPPPPMLPDAPNLNAFVNAFTPAAQPKPVAPPMWQNSGAFTNPISQQQIANQQQMLAQQQQMQAQQMMMQYAYRPNPFAMNPYANSLASQGPMTNGSRHYAGPMPPNNPFAVHASMPFPPMHPAQPQPAAMQPVQHQQAPAQQPTATQQVEQLIKVLRESPYPSQREWAAHSLTSHDWRVHSQIVPALQTSATQDPAASVRAGCVYCLGRMGVAANSK